MHSEKRIALILLSPNFAVPPQVGHVNIKPPDISDMIWSNAHSKDFQARRFFVYLPHCFNVFPVLVPSVFFTPFQVSGFEGARYIFGLINIPCFEDKFPMPINRHRGSSIRPIVLAPILFLKDESIVPVLPLIGSARHGHAPNGTLFLSRVAFRRSLPSQVLCSRMA